MYLFFEKIAFDSDNVAYFSVDEILEGNWGIIANFSDGNGSVIFDGYTSSKEAMEELRNWINAFSGK